MTNTNPSKEIENHRIFCPISIAERGEWASSIPAECDCSQDIPMGVSQWKNHGKKYGYWKFFEKELISHSNKQLIEEIERGIKKALKEYDYYNDSSVQKKLLDYLKSLTLPQ